MSDEDDEGRGELSTYMDDMDRELAQTKIGESFEKVTASQQQICNKEL